MEPGSEPQFEADVQIGKTFRYIDRRGTATIDGGRMSLRKREGDVIAEAPLAEVWADRVRGSLHLWLGGDRYIVAPLQVRRANPETLSGGVTNILRDINRLKQGKELTERFLRVVEAEGGHIGKPG